MDILGFIKGELLEIIEFNDDSRDTLSWRFPDEDKAIKNGAQLIVARVAGPAAPQGQVQELWIIAPDAAPVSLGLLGDAPLTVDYPDTPTGWTLAVSLEPAGGSPTGAPTGPVLAAGTITDL